MPDAHAPRLVDQPTAAPTRKVTASTLGAALASLLIIVGEASGLSVPAGAEAALTVLLTFAAGWFVREEDTPANPET